MNACTNDARLAWMALILSPGMGAIRSWRTMQRLGDAASLLTLPLTELEGLGLPAAAAQFVADGRALAAAEDEARKAEEAGVAFLTPEDEAYPERLRQIYDPPAVLWLRGDPAILNLPGIAVVGTRHPSTYGQGMAELLARDLAARGLVIQSGMARGVDTAAHKGALAAGGKTVAVWGTGVDVIYPKENKRLAEEILLKGGAIVSEFPLGTFPAPQNFPVRNRIISGMSVGVLVVEAGEYSGTRVTARCARELGWDIYAVPGNVTNKNAWGPNTLIKQGARLTATWEDIWEDLPSDVRAQLTAGDESSPGGTASLFPENAANGEGRLAGLGEQERQVLSALAMDSAVQLDELIEKLEGSMGPAEIFAALFELELAGLVRQSPGKNYVRVMV
jgi:DNA processing protein